MSMVLGCLLVLTILSTISIVSGSTLLSTSSSFDSGGSIFVNASESTLLVQSTVSIDVSALVGIIAVIGVIVVLVGIIGVQVVGSGLNSESVRAIFLGTTYTALWTFLSFLSAGMIIGIPIFGGIFYLLLTIVYVIGAVRHLGGASA